MIDATGNPQTVLLLGGTSEIGLAIVKEYLAKQPVRVVLGVQPGDELRDATVADLTASGATAVDVLDFDATAFDTHADVIGAAWRIADIDVAIVAFGLLGDAEELWQDQAKAVLDVYKRQPGSLSADDHNHSPGSAHRHHQPHRLGPDVRQHRTGAGHP